MEEERFGFDVNIDINYSQDSNLDENELEKIINEAKPANRSTRLGHCETALLVFFPSITYVVMAYFCVIT